MPKKGVSNNPKGRPKGSKNKATIMNNEIKEFIGAIVKGEYDNERVQNALVALYQEDKYKYLCALDKMQDKILPKVQEIKAEVAESIPIDEFLCNVEKIVKQGNI